MVWLVVVRDALLLAYFLYYQYKLNESGTVDDKVVHDRLEAFCRTRGLGARMELVEASDGRLTFDRVDGLLNSGRYEISVWRTVNAVMDKLEANHVSPKGELR